MAEPIHIVYWDASAVLSALFTDTHSKTAKRWVLEEGVHFISTLAYTEVCAVIFRMQRERLITETLRQSAQDVLNNGPWRRILTWPDWKVIGNLAAKWPLRGADLWHLATAKSMHQEFPELFFLSFDNRLNRAAKTESLCN